MVGMMMFIFFDGFNVAVYFVDRYVDVGDGDWVVLCCEGVDISYVLLQILMVRVVVGFVVLGVCREECVMFVMVDWIDFVVGIFGVFWGGMVAVLVNMMFIVADFGLLFVDFWVWVFVVLFEFVGNVVDVLVVSDVVIYFVVIGGAWLDVLVHVMLVDWDDVFMVGDAVLFGGVLVVATIDDMSALWLYIFGMIGVFKVAMYWYVNLWYVVQIYGV